MDLSKFNINDFFYSEEIGKARHKVTKLYYRIFETRTYEFYNDIICNIIISGSFVQPVLGYDVKLSKDGSIQTYYLFYSEPKYTLDEFVTKVKFDGDSRLYNTTQMKIILGIAKFLDVTSKLNIFDIIYSLSSVQISDCMEPKLFINSSNHFFLFGDDFYGYRLDEPYHYGLFRFFSPEDFEGSEHIKSKVFNFGSFLYFLFISPVDIEYHRFKYMKLIMEGGRLTNNKKAIPDYFWKMIELCWTQNPDDRPSFDELISTLLNRKEFHNDVDMEEVRKYYEELESSLQRTNEFINYPQFCSPYREIIKSYGISGHFKYYSIKNNPLFIFNNGSNQNGDNKGYEELKKEIEVLKMKNEELKKNEEELTNRLNYFISKEKKKEDKEKKKTKYLNINEINENYESIERIAIGGTSEIFKIEKSKIFARKMIISTDSTHESFRNMIKEFDFLVNINHPCIIKVEGINTGDECTPPSIIMKYEPFSLKDKKLLKEIQYYEEEEKKTINEFNTSIVIIIIEIIIGMRFIHWMKIIHRDLKPGNILITKNSHCKICDFGLSTAEDISTVKKTGGVGTLEYMAPEMLNEEENYSNKIDCYSFGVLLYYIISKGETPDIKRKDVMNGKKARIPNYFTKLSKEIIEECWNFDPEERPSFEDMLRKIKEGKYEILEGIELKRVEERIKFIEGFEINHPQEAA